MILCLSLLGFTIFIFWISHRFMNRCLLYYKIFGRKHVLFMEKDNNREKDNNSHDEETHYLFCYAGKWIKREPKNIGYVSLWFPARRVCNVQIFLLGKDKCQHIKSLRLTPQSDVEQIVSFSSEEKEMVYFNPPRFGFL